MLGIFPSGQTLETLPELSRDLSPELHAGRRRGRLRSGGVRAGLWAGLWATRSLQSVWAREPAAGVLRALAAFLEESGKLKAPEWAGGGVPKARASRREDGFGVRAACPARHLSLPGGAGGSSGPGARGGATATLRHTQPLQRTPQAPQGAGNDAKGRRWGLRTDRQGRAGQAGGTGNRAVQQAVRVSGGPRGRRARRIAGLGGCLLKCFPAVAKPAIQKDSANFHSHPQCVLDSKLFDNTALSWRTFSADPIGKQLGIIVLVYMSLVTIEYVHLFTSLWM